MTLHEENIAELVILVEEGKRIFSTRSIKMRSTLLIKGGRRLVVARNINGVVDLRKKTIKDIIANKKKVLKHKLSPMAKRNKQQRAFRLTDRGIRA